MRPLGTHYLIEPIYQTESTGGLILGVADRYPTSGWVWSIGSGCQEDVSKGDFVVMEEHGFSQDDLRHDTFFIRLKDGNGVHIVRADIDIEPVIREQWEKYKRTKVDMKVTTQDIDRNKESVSFFTSDIEDIQLGLYSETGYTLSYRHHMFLHPIDTGLDHPLMLVPEREILFSIPRAWLPDA